MRRTIGSNIGNEPRLGRDGRGQRARGVLVPPGRPVPADARDRRRTAGARDAGRPRARTSTRARPAASRTPRTTEDLVEVVTLRGEEWLLFHAFPIDVAVIRGTTADEDGNLTMEGEAVQAEMLDDGHGRAEHAAGSSSPRSGSSRRRGSLPQRDVKVPGALVDYVFVDPDQWQTYITQRLAVLRGRDAPAACARAAAAARRAQDHRPPLAARVPARATSATSASASASSSAASRGRRASPTSSC